MFRADWYTKFILTVIAGFLAWILLLQFRGEAVLAQSGTPTYAVERIETDMSGQFPKNLEATINKAAKGRELVSLVPIQEPPGRFYLAIFKAAH
jgi:hypothetical protein